jgi:hypothetical protein
MESDWMAVDGLIRDLGAAVAAATYVQGSVAKAVADQAIREASAAVERMLSAPGEAALATARDAVQMAQDVIVALDEEVARSRALVRRAVELNGRALELVEEARKARREP